MARLAEDMKKDNPDPSKVMRLNVWVKSRTKKDGTPVNTNAAEKIQMASEIESDAPSLSANPKDDHLSQILGPDNLGRMRAMGRGMSMSKLACYQVKNNTISQMQAEQVKLQQQIQDLQDVLKTKMSTNQRKEAEIVGENSAQRSVNAKSHPKCVLFDWTGAGEIIAEGRLFSSDRDDFVNDIPLGPNSVKVLIETATKPDPFLGRSAINMSTIEEAVGEMIAWHASNCILSDQELEEEDIAPKSPGTGSMNKCKLMDWAVNDETIVAEGQWESKEKQALVNGLPLGPSAVKIFVDVVLEPHTFLWRPATSMRNLEHSLKSYVAWPINRVVFETPTDTPISHVEKYTASPLSPISKSSRNNPEKVAKKNQKCKLMAISGKKRVVAEGRWASNNPNQIVHFVPLGLNAVRVWVDILKDKDAKVWRPCSEIECMDDAIGTSIAWPEDKVVIF